MDSNFNDSDGTIGQIDRDGTIGQMDSNVSVPVAKTTFALGLQRGNKFEIRLSRNR